MSSAASLPRYTPEQYLALERQAETKSEYYDGVIHAMSGATREHNLISLNLGGEINRQLKSARCEAYSGDMRVLVDSTGLYTYPDIIIVCDEPRFLDGEFDTLLNPTVLIEVLSPSTEAYDRGKKFRHYRRIASLREYVLVAQDRMSVERYARKGEDWVLTDKNSLDDVLRLDSVKCEVSLRDIYDKVQFPVDEDEKGAAS